MLGSSQTTGSIFPALFFPRVQQRNCRSTGCSTPSLLKIRLSLQNTHRYFQKDRTNLRFLPRRSLVKIWKYCVKSCISSGFTRTCSVKCLLIMSRAVALVEVCSLSVNTMSSFHAIKREGVLADFCTVLQAIKIEWELWCLCSLWELQCSLFSAVKHRLSNKRCQIQMKLLRNFFLFFSTLRLAIDVLTSSSKSKGHTRDNYNSSSLICHTKFSCLLPFYIVPHKEWDIELLAVNLLSISACILAFLQKQNNLLSAGFDFLFMHSML